MAKTDESNVWDQDPPRSGQAGSTFVKRTSNFKQVANAKVVRDDWDDDDDDDNEEQAKDVDGNQKHVNATVMERDDPMISDAAVEQDNGKIWEEANKRAPMPELVVASASTSQRLPPPPPAALQPTLRILKRPSASAVTNNTGVLSSRSPSSSSPGLISGSGSGGASLAPRGTLAEREAQYQEARSRIFGDKEKSGTTSWQTSSSSTSRTRSSLGGVVVVRDPLGPASEPEPTPGISSQDQPHGAVWPAKGFGERRREK